MSKGRWTRQPLYLQQVNAGGCQRILTSRPLRLCFGNVDPQRSSQQSLHCTGRLADLVTYARTSYNAVLTVPFICKAACRPSLLPNSTKAPLTFPVSLCFKICVSRICTDWASSV